MATPEPTALAIAEGVFGIAGLVGVIGAFVLVRALRRRSSGALVQGEVIRSSRRIDVRYVVDGVAYELHGSTNYNDAPRVGERIAVRYMPTKPSNASIAAENFAGAIAGLVVAIVFGLIGGGLLWFAYKVG